MQKVAVVATEKEYADFLMNNISKFMNRYAKFNSYSIYEIEKIDMITEDFVLLSAFNIFQKVRQKIGKNSELIVLSLSLNKMQMKKLEKIPKGTKALLVNFDNRSCMHTITSLYDAGYRDVELFPYFGEGRYDKNIKFAITPNEPHLVPKEIEKVINVGESSVDMNSLYKIADKLGVSKEFAEKEAILARKEYYYFNSSMDKILGEKEELVEKLNTLIKLMNEGIIITNVNGRIYLNNEKAQVLMKDRTKILIGFNITEVLPEVDVYKKKEQLIKIGDRNVIISPVEIKNSSELLGHIFTLSDFEEIEEKQHGMRSKLSESNHIAKYHFSDIIAKSDEMKEVIEDSKRIAKSDAPVMIIGESGTGKEMFAQSIHNESVRKKYNFVAVNCAAISENLLESEMFGYEEGSFTGAKKGGKIGFFELAHRGTIFLDEIGEMPIKLQSKLLRVIEEKKVIRVGSYKNIDIDVRIIAATNKDLFEMMENKSFREDLYYRLNVLPIKIPSLRERREDILEIFNFLCNKINLNIRLSSDAIIEIENYFWRGNVRELRNVVEYISSKGKNVIFPEDLPFYGVRNRNISKKKDNFEQIEEIEGISNLSDRFILNEGRDIILYEIILKILKEFSERKIRIGRQKIVSEISCLGYIYSEGEVRKALSKLSSYGFARSSKGRGGTVITPEGEKLYIRIQQMNRTSQ